MMKIEILDIRRWVTLLLVLVSLIGQKWSNHHENGTDAQNLTFVNVERQIEEICFSSEMYQRSLGEEYETINK